MKKASSILSLALIAGFSQSANAADAQTLQANKGEVLVLLSSENIMQLADGKTAPTGYYLNEFGVPAKALAGA